MRDYVTSSEYHRDTEKMRELLSKLTDGQKLKILQCTKSQQDEYALHVAAYRDDAEMITIILSSLDSPYRLDPLIKKDFIKLTPLHMAARGGHTESVKAILNSLTADQQIRLLGLLPEQDGYGKTAVMMVSGETADVLSEYKNKAREKADPGEFFPLNSSNSHGK